MQPTGTMPLHHQNFMLAVRREMGWLTFRPANDCIAFCSGRTMDFTVGSEMARIAQTLRKDAVYTGWENGRTTTSAPSSRAFCRCWLTHLTVPSSSAGPACSTTYRC